MRFEYIYKETEENLRLALESMWAPGTHPMRNQIEELFRREPLLAEPVFQSMFGWEAARDGSWRDALNPNVVSRLGIGSRFAPYEHQAKSWKALKEGKSIVLGHGPLFQFLNTRFKILVKTLDIAVKEGQAIAQPFS